jgi:hypothetical protein
MLLLKQGSVLSHVRGSVTKNSGFWIGSFDVFALLLRLQPVITAHTQWIRLAPFLTELRVYSLPLWLTWFWFTNWSLLQFPLSAGSHFPAWTSGLSYWTELSNDVSLTTESGSLCDWWFTANQFVFCAERLETHGQNFSHQFNPHGHSPYTTQSLMRGWVCQLKLLLALASTSGANRM